jgi:hypothetical protein
MMLQSEVRNDDVTSLSYEMKMKQLSKELWWYLDVTSLSYEMKMKQLSKELWWYLFRLLTKETTSWIGLVRQNKL